MENAHIGLTLSGETTAEALGESTAGEGEASKEFIEPLAPVLKSFYFSTL